MTQIGFESDGRHCHFEGDVLNRLAVMQSGKERQMKRTFIYEQELYRETDICQRNLPVRLQTPKQSVLL